MAKMSISREELLATADHELRRVGRVGRESLRIYRRPGQDPNWRWQIIESGAKAREPGALPNPVQIAAARIMKQLQAKFDLK